MNVHKYYLKTEVYREKTIMVSPELEDPTPSGISMVSQN